MTDPTPVGDESQLTDLPRPEVEELTAEDAQGVCGGALIATTKNDEGPEERITFVYGGLQVGYTQQSP